GGFVTVRFSPQLAWHLSLVAEIAQGDDMAFNHRHDAIDYFRSTAQCKPQRHKDTEKQISAALCLCVSVVQNGFPNVKEIFSLGSSVPSGLLSGLKFIPKSTRAGRTGV